MTIAAESVEAVMQADFPFPVSALADIIPL